MASAITLNRKGFETRVVEADHQLGGRVKTKKASGGILMDVGFQVLLNSYPELKNFVDLQALNLKTFNSGAVIFQGEKLQLLANPIVHPKTLIPSIFSDLLTIKDKALVLKLIAESQQQKYDDPMGNQSTENFLIKFGFSKNFIELFWRPFMSGIYLDSKLENGHQFFKFLIRCFCFGQVSVPENGMAELPLQMASQLPVESIYLNQAVKSWTSQSVTLTSGEILQAKKVICTIDPTSLINKNGEQNYRSVTTHYFTSENLNHMDWDKWLVLIPQKFKLGLSHFCLMSSIAKSYGNGQPLLSASQIGSTQGPVAQIIDELNHIAKSDLKLQLIQSFFVQKALPRITKNSAGFEIIDGVVFAGDRFASPSINGALRSGRLAAEKIISELKLGNKKDNS